MVDLETARAATLVARLETVVQTAPPNSKRALRAAVLLLYTLYVGERQRIGTALSALERRRSPCR